MTVSVQYFSWFKDLAGCAGSTETIPAGSTLGELHDMLVARHPRLASMQHSTLMAVGVEYQKRGYVLNHGDEVSLFPPVQGG